MKRLALILLKGLAEGLLSAIIIFALFVGFFFIHKAWVVWVITDPVFAFITSASLAGLSLTLTSVSIRLSLERTTK